MEQLGHVVCIFFLALRSGVIALVALLASMPVTALAQDWPQKPIKLVVPYTPGGGTDIMGRLVGRSLSQALSVPVVIENRPGSDGSIGSDIVAKAAPDGYTLLIDGTSQAFNVAFGKKLPYNSARDLAPIAQVANQQVLLLVNAKLPVKNLKELIAYLRANPGKLSYGSIPRLWPDAQ